MSQRLLFILQEATRREPPLLHAKMTKKDKKKKTTYISVYYDVETCQSQPVEGKPNTFEHIPNLFVSQAVCDKCVDVAQNDHFCVACKSRQHIFHNLDDPNMGVMEQFFDYCSILAPKRRFFWWPITPRRLTSCLRLSAS